MDVRQIINLSPAQTEALHARGVSGDADALRDYIFSCQWREIARRRGFSAKAKAEVFRALIESVRIDVEYLAAPDHAPAAAAARPVGVLDV